MSFFSHPTVARSVARLMQYGTAVGARRMTRSANERLPEFPRHAQTLQVPTTFGSTRITAYRPESNESVRPVYVNLHGGGFVLSLTDYDDPICRALAARSGAVGLNVEYVVAPQHPFPAPPHHVYEILQWVVGNGSAHGWDGTRLAIGGQSAGGALAAAAARLVLERGEPPGLAGRRRRHRRSDWNRPGRRDRRRERYSPRRGAALRRASQTGWVACRIPRGQRRRPRIRREGRRARPVGLFDDGQPHSPSDFSLSRGVPGWNERLGSTAFSFMGVGSSSMGTWRFRTCKVDPRANRVMQQERSTTWI